MRRALFSVATVDLAGGGTVTSAVETDAIGVYVWDEAHRYYDLYPWSAVARLRGLPSGGSTD